MRIYVGTSGWQYKDWRGTFYPPKLPQRGWLEYFSARFPTVEVNNTFYMLPPGETFANWREGSAEDFVITVKANRFITHMKRLRDPDEPLKLFWERAVRLGPKLGPVLFQLPPNFRAEPGRLEDFIAALPDEVRPAFEFRHPSWETEQVYELLDKGGCSLVLADRPGWRVRSVVTAGWSYVRFHRGDPVGWGYAREKLRRWADKIAALPAREVWVYFNNDPGAAAVRDAVTFTELLRRRSSADVRGPALDD